MKVIDLLNKVANQEEVPDYIEYEGILYKWTGLNYYNEQNDEYLDNHICLEDLEYPVEFVVKNKKIKKLNELNNESDESKRLRNKINEIIDYINKE